MEAFYYKLVGKGIPSAHNSTASPLNCARSDYSYNLYFVYMDIYKVGPSTHYCLYVIEGFSITFLHSNIKWIQVLEEICSKIDYFGEVPPGVLSKHFQSISIQMIVGQCFMLPTLLSSLLRAKILHPYILIN